MSRSMKRGMRAAPQVDAERRQPGGDEAALGNAALLEMLGVDGRGASDPSGGGLSGVAAEGVQGGGGPLPFFDLIQAAFGHHDLSEVRAHFDGSAAAATGELGASAYARGEDIAFGSQPELHTAAHEAAHVVQQRSGVQLEGGGSRPGDPYERHADAVADKVVRGESAEGLLDQMSGGGSSEEAVQAEGGFLDWAKDRIGDWTNTREDEERLDAEEDLQAFMARTYSEEHFHPSTGRGNFDAAYDPGAGALTISVSVFFQFRDGSPTNPDWVANTAASDPTFPADAFVWTDDEKTGFAAETISQVQRHWSRRYTFHNTREHWEALPNVNVNVVVTESDSAGDAHFNIEVFKWPDDRVDDAHIDRPGVNHGADHAGHQHDGGTDSDHVGGEFNENSADGSVATPDVSDFRRTTSTRAAYGQADTDNPTPITFAEGSSTLSGADKGRIGTFTTTMSDPAMPDFDLTVTGHASGEGAADVSRRLSEDRARVVSNELVTGGVKSQPRVVGAGEDGPSGDATWRRVDIHIGAFEAQQTTVLHEFGHVFGLADEYPSADTGSRTVGTAVDHSQLAEDLGLTPDPVVAHHSDSIMSNGEVVEPYHYATFLEVLGTMTDTTGQWEAGPGPGPAMGPGDFPAPSPGGPAYA